LARVHTEAPLPLTGNPIKFQIRNKIRRFHPIDLNTIAEFQDPPIRFCVREPTTEDFLFTIYGFHNHWIVTKEGRWKIMKSTHR